MSQRRDELIAEISYRMKQSHETMMMLEAMEINKQPNNALENWLKYLKRSNITGRKEQE